MFWTKKYSCGVSVDRYSKKPCPRLEPTSPSSSLLIQVHLCSQPSLSNSFSESSHFKYLSNATYSKSFSVASHSKSLFSSACANPRANCPTPAKANLSDNGETKSNPSANYPRPLQTASSQILSASICSQLQRLRTLPLLFGHSLNFPLVLQAHRCPTDLPGAVPRTSSHPYTL